MNLDFKSPHFLCIGTHQSGTTWFHTNLRRHLGIWLLFLALPFAMLAWLLPFVSTEGIGNDYPVYSLHQQLHLMWSVWSGTFPLYMPGFAVGHSTAAMTLGQLYHPLSWLSSVMPGYWDGFALEWNTVLRLLSLGIAQVCVFKLCRRLSLGALASFLVSFAVVYNLRMLDSFRYGASLEAYVGMLFAATAVGFVFLDSGSKRPISFLALGTYLTLVCGHPQWAFFGLVGTGLFALFFPWIAAAIHPDIKPPSYRMVFRYLARLCAGFGLGALVSSPYLLTFYFEYLKTNSSRVQSSYDWTLGYGDSVRGELSNFLFPLHADVHGAFGGSAMFLLVALFPVVVIVRRAPWALWLAYALCALALLFAMGKATVVHAFMVTHLPFFDSFRVPGRLVLWIPLFALPIWAWLFHPANRRALVATGVAALVVFALYWAWPEFVLPATESYSPHAVFTDRIPPYFYTLIFQLAGASLALLVSAAAWKRFSRPLFMLATIPLVLSTALCLYGGTWKEPKQKTPSFGQISENRKASVASHAYSGDGIEMSTVTAYLEWGLNPQRSLGTIVHRVEHVATATSTLERLKRDGVTSSTFLDRPVNHRMSLNTSGTGNDVVKLVYNTSNRFVFEVVSSVDGYFVLGQPWLPGFLGVLDGREVEVVKANVMFPAIFLPKGAHTVEFRFISRPFLVGAIIAFLAACGWAWWAFPRRRLLVSISALVIGAALAGLAHPSLLPRGSFGTQYQWTSDCKPGSTHCE